MRKNLKAKWHKQAIEAVRATGHNNLNRHKQVFMQVPSELSGGNPNVFQSLCGPCVELIEGMLAAAYRQGRRDGHKARVTAVEELYEGRIMALKEAL